MSPRELERLFLRAITWPTGIEGFLAHADDATRRAFAEAFAGTPDLDAVARMSIYADGYFYRLADVLRQQYPVCAWVLGGDAFHDLTTDYVLERPSRDPDIRNFGRDFPAFVGEHSVLRVAPFLPDVAAVEWALVEAIDAPDEEHLAAAVLAAVPATTWPSLRFRFATAVRLLTPCVDFALLARAARSETPFAALSHLLRGSAAPVLVFREGFTVRHRTLVESEAAAMASLIAGETLEEACAHAVRADARVTPDVVVQWIHGWIASHLICGVSASEVHTSFS